MLCTSCHASVCTAILVDFLTDIFFNLLLKQQIEFIQNHKNFRSSIDNVYCGSCHKNLKTIWTFVLFCYCATLSLFCYCTTLSLFCYCTTLSLFCYCTTLSLFCYCTTLSLFCYCTTLSFFRTIITHPKYF